MKIKKIEVCGFKSFVDRTVLHIDHDVTSVVGPNGCGKSNIVDAIRWAMGEQSARHLRGQAMEDVIFNGCETRGPHSFAEVTLTFDNTDGLAPPEYRDFPEIAVTRRLDRSGTSEYVINKTQVRLKDVTQLFLGTGVGTKAYSIIEQGRIGFIVSAKPTDRRHLIEEAAGITKFKAKKKAAERKMDQTRQNLLRVGDIVGEIEKGLASLKRQAQKAERYKAYRAEMRDLELLVAAHRFLELTVTERSLGARLSEMEADVDGRRLGLRMREAELGADRLALELSEQAVSAAQRRAHELDQEVRALESKVEGQLSRLLALAEAEAVAQRERVALGEQKAALGEEAAQLAASLKELEAAEAYEADTLAEARLALDGRKEAASEAERSVHSARAGVSAAQGHITRGEAVLSTFARQREEGQARLERLLRDAEELEKRAAEAAQQVETLRARSKGLEEGKAQSGQRKEALEAELGVLKGEIREREGALESLREETATRRSRLRSLEEIQQRFEGVGRGVRALMTELGRTERERADAGILGLVADRLECDEGLTEALAAALDERLQYVVVRDEAAMDTLHRFLVSDERGRATIIPQSPTMPEPRSADHAEAAPAWADEEGVVGWLPDLVRTAPEDGALSMALLRDVWVVECSQSARRLRQRGCAATLVTRGGELWSPEGALSAGQGEGQGAHMIAVKREIRSLHEQVGELDTALQEAVAGLGAQRARFAEQRAALDASRSEAHAAEIAIVKAEKDLRRAEEEVQRTGRQRERVGGELDELRAKLTATGSEEDAVRAQIEAAQKELELAQAALEAALAVFEARRSEVEAQAQALTEVQVRAAEAKQRAQGDRAALERLTRSIEELVARGERLEGDLMRGAEQQGRTGAQAFVAKEQLGERVQEAVAAHGALEAAKARYDEARAELSAREGALTGLRQQIDRAERALGELKLEDQAIQKDLLHLVETVRERHRVELAEVLLDHHARELPDAAVHARIDELSRLVERMGEINLTAIEEYEEKQARHTYLCAQREDLEKALSQLDRAIRQMNRESRRLFKDTFEAVNTRFQKVFPTLFGGGKAELKLTDPADMLETGVEIIAQPPGKRLGSIELMSGGEKALTAVSLIFSIFQHRPSPFCLLDEVDAPLDEANIGRFAEAIRAMTGRSQFIVITHSKATMQMADVLYGVTMETPGISKLVSVELRRGNRVAA